MRSKKLEADGAYERLAKPQVSAVPVAGQ
jgi:hypothetical protein